MNERNDRNDVDQLGLSPDRHVAEEPPHLVRGEVHLHRQTWRGAGLLVVLVATVLGIAALLWLTSGGVL